MKNPLKFRVSSALKNIIGRDLITDDYIAIFELVKNGFDAHANRVDIFFKNIYSSNPKILIIDNGKGMDYNDLIEKWLFVAYSAKKEGTEDNTYNYRDNINTNRFFAGAKGIGRFSCDKLGKILYLETIKKDLNPKVETLFTEWEKFEEDIKDNFVDIDVLHETIKKSHYNIKNGTILEISELREVWDRHKFLKLKDSLSKLINPINENNFEIYIHVEEELENDIDQEYYNRVNGKVENFIFDALNIKTTKIISKISEDGKIITELYDGGKKIYKVIEKNKEFLKLHNINYEVYYLNHSAKMTFALRMGLPSVQYGHIFLYKNGFRVYPYGEPGEDSFKIDQRKSQGYNRYLGTRELIGQIQINGNNNSFIETSSRGDGLVKNEYYEELVEYFWIVLRRLEKYVVEVQRWGLSIEDNSSFDMKSRITDLLAKLTDSSDILDFQIEDDFLELIDASQNNSANSIVDNLNRIAHETKNENLIRQARKASEYLAKINYAKIEAERLAEEERKKASDATKKLREQISENLFLKSINSSDYKEVISLLHHIGIYAGTIDNNLKGISLRVQNSIELSKEDLNDIIRLLSFETKKILNVVTFATKANFKLDTEYKEVDLVNYMLEYIQNIIPSITDKSLNIKIDNSTSSNFIRRIKPIEINIIIDNLINNSKKAKSNNLLIKFEDGHQDNSLDISFIDDGIGIEEKFLDKIFDLGYTTTDGSGIGLYHVNQIVESMKSKISVTNNKEKGISFKIHIK
ncbi:ATP-binding protein [Flavobacterium sp.]|jgi:signal transduction histidine kinase|uniref:sensor histidine kinase n=1 Tax=Flavobacterium sp. TaxID=239 RepID=UPI00333FD116